MVYHIQAEEDCMDTLWVPHSVQQNSSFFFRIKERISKQRKKNYVLRTHAGNYTTE